MTRLIDDILDEVDHRSADLETSQHDEPDQLALLQAARVLLQHNTVALHWLTQHLSGRGAALQAVAVGQHSSSSNSSSGSGSGGAAVDAKIIRQADQLKQSICEVLEGYDESTGDVAARDLLHHNCCTAVSQLGAQLASFGSALAAVLPSKHCCNHTGCSNLARLS
jgi:hypothetical protein